MDPYKVLGIAPDADEETVKKAYRALVKKYHPDRYANSPMQETAAEKMKEINKAYDMITKGKTFGSERETHNYGSYNSCGHEMPRSFESVRILISLGQLDAALRMLSILPQNAEWYYLRGLINLRRGYYDSAYSDIEKATVIDPANATYRSTLESMREQNTTYRNVGFGDGLCCDCMPCMCVPCCCPCGC